MKQVKIPLSHICQYCKENEREKSCVYCTDCRLRMAKKEIEPDYVTEYKKKVKVCHLCKREVEGKYFCNSCKDL